MSISKPNHNQTGFLPAEEMREIEMREIHMNLMGNQFWAKGIWLKLPSHSSWKKNYNHACRVQSGKCSYSFKSSTYLDCSSKAGDKQERHYLWVQKWISEHTLGQLTVSRTSSKHFHLFCNFQVMSCFKTSCTRWWMTPHVSERDEGNFLNSDPHGTIPVNPSVLRGHGGYHDCCRHTKLLWTE